VSVKERLVPGQLVTKGPQNLPQSATANLFTITGGAVLVTAMFGVVTTAIQALANSLSVGTTLSGTAIMPASSISGVAANSWITPFGTAFSAAQSPFITSAQYASQYSDRMNPFLCATGNITWACTASATGQIKWYLYWLPVDAGAAVT
jgi:hypothetical protein